MNKKRHSHLSQPINNKTNHLKKNDRLLWLYGRHPVEAALQNPRRQAIQLLLTPGTTINTSTNFPTRVVSKAELESLLPAGAVHQGMALSCYPLQSEETDSFLKKIATKDKSVLLLLDQVTDPHNVGAMLRSAVAFHADAVFMPADGAPDETGVLAKSASGALDMIPLIKVTNLTRLMEKLKEQGFWCIGMDGNAPKATYDDTLPKKCAFVMGSEGDGLRRLTRETCDYMTKLPIDSKIDSLNVSNAAAIVLYEWNRQHHG